MEAVSVTHVTTMTVSNFTKNMIYQTKQLGAVKGFPKHHGIISMTGKSNN